MFPRLITRHYNLLRALGTKIIRASQFSRNSPNPYEIVIIFSSISIAGSSSCAVIGSRCHLGRLSIWPLFFRSGERE